MAADFGSSPYNTAAKQEKSLAVGQFFTFTEVTTVKARYQNFFVDKTVKYNNLDHIFLPFGFSGVTISTDGANLDASILLPSLPISRDWAIDAAENRWFISLTTLLIDPDATALTTSGTHFLKLTEYNGQVTAAAWTESELTLNINTVLDAAGADLPARRLTQRLCGSIPTTSRVSMQ